MEGGGGSGLGQEEKITDLDEGVRGRGGNGRASASGCNSDRRGARGLGETTGQIPT